jgi:MoaA/NifB/PqqE/SkfB family radical SAM enzyme
MFYSEIKKLEIENSSICNAACPQCLRENFPGDYSRFDQTYLSTDFFQYRIPDKIYNNISSILLSGSLGDPCSAPNILEVCKILKEKAPQARINISTNGGMKSTKFWKEMGSILSKHDKIIFAIDGLEDTNDIYRVNVKWKKVIENSSAFIDSGGSADWQFIVFKHNEHQIEQARQLSKDLGFENFFYIKTHRFFLDDMIHIDRIGSRNIKLEAPENPEYKNVIFFKTDFKKKKIDEWLKESENSKITCAVRKEGSVFIDHQGRIFPCCFLAAGLYSRTRFEPVNDGWKDIWINHGQDNINLHHRSWDEIIDSEFWKNIHDSWEQPFPKRLATCSGTCSDSTVKFNNIKD